MVRAAMWAVARVAVRVVSCRRFCASRRCLASRDRKVRQPEANRGEQRQTEATSSHGRQPAAIGSQQTQSSAMLRVNQMATRKGWESEILQSMPGMAAVRTKAQSDAIQRTGCPSGKPRQLKHSNEGEEGAAVALCTLQTEQSHCTPPGPAPCGRENRTALVNSSSRNDNVRASSVGACVVHGCVRRAWVRALWQLCGGKRRESRVRARGARRGVRVASHACGSPDSSHSRRHSSIRPSLSM